MRIRSRICDMLGIEHPVFQGGMAWVADASLASAVSNAGEYAGMVKKLESAEEIVKSLMTEGEKVMKVNLNELWIEE